MSHVTKQGSSSEYECWCRCVSIYRKERGFEGPVEGHQQYKGQYLNLGLITQAVIVEIVEFLGYFNQCKLNCVSLCGSDEQQRDSRNA